MVGGQGQAPSLAAEVAGRLEEQRDVGPPEAVDRLLRIADEEQAAGCRLDLLPGLPAGALIGRRHQHRQLHLDRVGVLELVEEQPAVAVVQRGADGRTVLRVAQHLPGHHQQVVELQAPVTAAVLGGLQREPAQLDGDALEGGVGDLVGEQVALLHEVLQLGTQRRQVVALGPARLGPLAVGARLGATALRTAECQAGRLVGRRVHLLHPLLQLAQQAAQRVVAVVAVRLLAAGLLHGSDDRRQPGLPLGQLGCVGGCPLGHEVPVLVEGQGDLAQGGEPDPGGGEQQDRPGQRGIVQQVVDQLGPAVVEGDHRRHLVEHLDARRQARLDGVLGQDPLGEAVQRADGGGIEVVEGRLAALQRRGVAGTASALGGGVEPATDPVAQLGGRLLGEGDRGDRTERLARVEHEGKHAVDQGTGLAGTRAGFDEQGLVERGADPLGGGVVGVGAVNAGHAGHAGTATLGSASSA